MPAAATTTSADEGGDRGGGGGGCGGDACRRLPRRAARMERRVGDAGRAAAAGGPAPAGRARCGGRTPAAKLVVFVTAGRALHIPREVEESADAIFWTAHVGSFAGDAIADILAGIGEPDGAALARVAVRRRDHLGLRHAAGADRPAGGAGGGGVGDAAAAPPLVRLLPRPRGALAGGLLLRRGLFLHELRALGLGARAAGSFRLRGARRSTASVRVTNTGSRAGHRDGASLLPGHGLRGAGAAAPRAARPPAGDARSGGVRRRHLHGDAGDARQVRPRLGGRQAGLARPRPGGEPRPAFPRPARGAGARRDRALRRRALRAPLHCWCRRRRDDDLGLPARRPEQHGEPRRRRRHRALAGGGALRHAGGRDCPARRRDRDARGQRRALPDREALRAPTSSPPSPATTSSSSRARSAARASGTTAGTRATISTTTSSP